MSKVKKLLGAGLVTGVLGFMAAPSADAALNITLRETGTNATSKVLTPASVGQVINLQVLATVTGGANPGIVWMQGGFTSANDPVQGGVASGPLVSVVASAFRAPGFQHGNQLDADSDGDMDIGGGAPGNVAGWWYARSSIPAVTPVVLGTLTFTVSSVNDSNLTGSTVIRFAPRGGGAIPNAGAWTLDSEAINVEFEDFSSDTATYNGFTLTVIPEPASFGILGLGGLGLLARRRRA
jgi:hypothetical protein